MEEATLPNNEAPFLHTVITEETDNSLKLKILTLYHSTLCKYIYLFILATTCILIFWVVADFVDSIFPTVSFYIIELVICLILTADIIIRFWILGCLGFCHSASNLFQFTLVCICLILTILTIARIFLIT